MVTLVIIWRIKAPIPKTETGICLSILEIPQEDVQAAISKLLRLID